MKLNIDCIRDILLCVEDNTGYRKHASFVDIDKVSSLSNITGCEAPKIWPYQDELMKTYTNQELMYHFKYCIDAKLLETDDRFGTQQFLVIDLTPLGHEAIANLRSPTVFETVKTLAEKLCVSSLTGICQLANSVTAQVIQAHLNIS